MEERLVRNGAPSSATLTKIDLDNDVDTSEFEVIACAGEDFRIQQQRAPRLARSEANKRAKPSARPPFEDVELKDQTVYTQPPWDSAARRASKKPNG